MLNIEKYSEENMELVEELRKREFEARDKGDLKEAQFLMKVKHRVQRSVAIEHGDSTKDICPCCQKLMDIKHGVFCQYCGQLVK